MNNNESGVYINPKYISTVKICPQRISNDIEYLYKQDINLFGFRIPIRKAGFYDVHTGKYIASDINDINNTRQYKCIYENDVYTIYNRPYIIIGMYQDKPMIFYYDTNEDAAKAFQELQKRIDNIK